MLEIHTQSDSGTSSLNGEPTYKHNQKSWSVFWASLAAVC